MTEDRYADHDSALEKDVETEVLEQEEYEAMRNLPAVQASEAIVARGELTVADVVEQHDKIVQIMAAVMRDGIHYGVIPGVNKPSLFKPGAEAINVALRLAPHYDSEKIWHEDGHLTVVANCTLKHIPTDLTIATGEGLCSTKESRYAYRTAKRTCPLCGEPQIRKSRNQPRSGDYEGANPSDPPGWYCWRKEGGCGANFAHNDESITSQEEGKAPNPDLPDQYNTVLKMADKRALIAAVLNGTAASDVFTQDVEDKTPAGGSYDESPYGDSGGEPPSVPKENQPLAPPKSWAQITEYVSAYDEDAYNIFNKFADAARRRLFPGSTDTKSLKKEERDELFQVTARAALALRNEVDVGKFPPPSVEEISKAWAAVMEGDVLAIEMGEETNDKG